MNKNKIFIIVLAIIFSFLTLFGGNISVNIDSCANDISIENYNATLKITDSGDLEVIEEYTYNYSGNYHAKYRDVETMKYNPQNPIAQSVNDTAQLADINGVLFSNVESLDITSLVKVEIDGVLYPSVEISDLNRGYSSSQLAYVGVTGERDEQGNIIGCEPFSSTCESIFVYIPEGFGKNTVFTYSYTIKGAVTLYQDIASLNWKLFEYNEADIKKGSVSITFPEGSKIDDLRCWARGAEKEGDILIESDNQINLTFKKIRNDSALEIRALSNKEIYPNVALKNIVEASALEDILEFEEKQSKVDNLRITFSQILYYGAFVLIIGMIFVFIHAYKKYDKEYTPEFNNEYLRELPDENLTPAEMSYLYYFGKINDEDCTATLLDLVRKKYLILDTNLSGVNDDDPNFAITKGPQKDYSDLKEHEKMLINWFINDIGDGTTVTIEQIENYTKTEAKANKFMYNSSKFVNSALVEAKKHGFIERGLTKGKAISFVLIPVMYLIISLVLSSIYNLDASFAIGVSLVLSIAYIIYVATIKKRTKHGAEEFAKWKAFKNFLEDFGQMEDYPMPGVIIWEKYLVYATSLKMADKVMEQLKVKLPEVMDESLSSNEWYDDNDATFMRYGYRRRYYYGYYFGRINHSYSIAKQTGYRTIAAAQARRSSGGGRGGGFSGGSSFGGGGGGGRSR